MNKKLPKENRSAVFILMNLTDYFLVKVKVSSPSIIVIAEPLTVPVKVSIPSSKTIVNRNIFSAG
jgi:hypothetical protein